MLKSINKVIKILVFSDLVLLFAWGLVTPILAIFIVQSIKGGDAQVAGIAIGIYWLTKSLIQIPIANFLDKKQGEKDDYYVLIGGIVLASFVPIGFIFATLPWHMYLLQLVHALGMAFVIPSWSGIFTRHIEKGREAFCWSLDSSALGIGAGVAGIVGGTIAKTFGFSPLFIGVTILGVISALMIILIKNDLLPKERVYPLPKPH
jgi:MFS family permease